MLALPRWFGFLVNGGVSDRNMNRQPRLLARWFGYLVWEPDSTGNPNQRHVGTSVLVRISGLRGCFGQESEPRRMGERENAPRHMGAWVHARMDARMGDTQLPVASLTA